MAYSVFIDKIGKIYDGDDAINEFERYKDMSQQGIGRFAKKNVYLLDDKGSSIKSFGVTAFASGGTVLDNTDVIKNFIIGKKIDNNKVSEIGFTALQGNGASTLIYKNNDGEFPLITIRKESAIFHKSNFSPDTYIDSMADIFRDICIKNGLKFLIQ